MIERLGMRNHFLRCGPLDLDLEVVCQLAQALVKAGQIGFADRAAPVGNLQCRAKPAIAGGIVGIQESPLAVVFVPTAPAQAA
ncbi:MAG: hypothetical protein NTY41_07870, partial [Proteobacteria bacterium]|nr:hypothetical protein [Pseudomonadota bacterium]